MIITQKSIVAGNEHSKTVFTWLRDLPICTIVAGTVILSPIFILLRNMKKANTNLKNNVFLTKMEVGYVIHLTSDIII